MVTGGPRVIMIGWIVVGFFALLVGMAMGEICSAYPTSRAKNPTTIQPIMITRGPPVTIPSQ